jgi:copper homeostasis protein
MLYDIEAAKAANAAGVVIGVLTAGGEVDVPLARRLCEAARPELAVTFHRAIDSVPRLAHSAVTAPVLGSAPGPNAGAAGL